MLSFVKALLWQNIDIAPWKNYTAPMNIQTIMWKGTKCYLLETPQGLLLFDTGWVNEYGTFRDKLKEINISPRDIQWFMVSHFHIDHAGLAGVLQNNGKEFIVFENQRDHISEMEQFIEKKGYVYTKINRETITHKKLEESRDWLNTIGIDGEALQVFGHEDQSIVLLLDDGNAFIGDLPVIYEYDDTVKRDWDMLLAKNIRHIHPAHAKNMEIGEIMDG
jgi:glyoxylase-like metal-dependent hydrolase (beta-lactamase superfamily II)